MPGPGWRKCTAYRQTGPGILLLALRLSEGLGRTGEGLPQLGECMTLILGCPERAGKSSRGTPRLRGPQQALHGAVRLASKPSRCCRGEAVFPLFGSEATVPTAQRSTPLAASSCVWTGRLQAGPDSAHPPSEGHDRHITCRCCPLPRSARL